VHCQAQAIYSDTAPQQLREILERAGAAVAPEALGWQRAFYGEAVRHAREIRNRYTFLDLAADGGVLDRFAPS
jgi:glycerol-1-phosphate dehydrogenase [NAD(P)+]